MIVAKRHFYNMTGFWRTQFKCGGAMKDINREQLHAMNELLHEDFVLINVLPVDKFNAGHIRTSVNIPLNDEDFITQVEIISGDKDRKIVVYSQNVECDAAKQAAQALERARFTDVAVYSAGVDDWLKYQALERIVG